MKEESNGEVKSKQKIRIVIHLPAIKRPSSKARGCASSLKKTRDRIYGFKPGKVTNSGAKSLINSMKSELCLNHRRTEMFSPGSRGAGGCGRWNWEILSPGKHHMVNSADFTFREGKIGGEKIYGRTRRISN